MDIGRVGNERYVPCLRTFSQLVTIFLWCVRRSVHQLDRDWMLCCEFFNWVRLCSNLIESNSSIALEWSVVCLQELHSVEKQCKIVTFLK